MNGHDICMAHSGHKERLHNIEKDQSEAWKAIDRAHDRIDSMKNWVIAGMTSLVLQLIIFIGGLIILWMKL